MKKKYKAIVNYNDKKIEMYLNGENKNSVIKNITDFFMKVFKNKQIIIDVELEEINNYE